jgi:phosphatidylglycerol:prolipoprotein diacylglycerol transferase
MPIVIPYPSIDPVLVDLGPVPIRWYALAYIAGLMLGWAYARLFVEKPELWGASPRLEPAVIDDLLVYAAIGVVLGGRLGYVLFYNLPYYLDHPIEVLSVWKGGMAFHGGFLGATLALVVLAARRKCSVLALADVCAAAVPIGIFLGRVANFIKPELWGRPTDVAWAMVFPGAGPEPRHPSQLYEAGLEGLALFLLLGIAIRLGALRRPGLVTGLFCAGYGVARITCELFREPDPQLGFLFGDATMGMLLSLPLIAVGLVFISRALRRSTAFA